MKNLKNCGRVFYGLGIAGIGFMHFLYPGFRPIIIPLPPADTQNIAVLILVFGGYLVASGLLISFGKFVQPISVALGYILLLFLIFGHLPNRLRYHPEIHGYWIDAVKLLALSGGAFVISLAFPDEAVFKPFKKSTRIAVAGKYLFAIMLVNFGIGHLLNPVLVGQLVPAWIPFPVFWAYFTGLALVGAGLSIFFKYQTKYIGLLLASMLLTWLLSLHIPLAVKFPAWRDGENIIGSLECLAFCGIAITIALSNEIGRNKNLQGDGPDKKH
ncbi:hypothetical protein [Chitinophaga niabensis]|uniref:DoxX protein n=1 Tax=Chitinophaga niabensis TaxID=536979 RepID=A0A1N6J002_9BACT|nr:hypothetical protein [Chitinophaga niabensis]SIO37571.1 hypothetical protein SAMN04488055_3502 [Chitinophaga niabensis]